MGEGDVYLPPRPQHGGFTGVLMDFNCSYVIPNGRISIAGPNMPSSSGPEWRGHPTSGCRRLYTTLAGEKLLAVRLNPFPDRPQTVLLHNVGEPLQQYCIPRTKIFSTRVAVGDCRIER